MPFKVSPTLPSPNLSLQALVVLTLVLLTLCASPVMGQEEDSYRSAFNGKFLIGAALSQGQLFGLEPGTLDLVSRQFNAVTAENDMKWERLQPEEGYFDFEAADALVAFAESHAMDITGHVLLWHSQTPDWVFQDDEGGPAGREQLLGRLEQHMKTILDRYRGRVRAWDVVNEALNEDGSLRDSPWRRILGDDYVVEAFRIAHELDPKLRLVYNDYNLFKPEKRAGVVQLVRAIQAAGVPIHAVGMQGHYGLGYPESLDEVRASIRAFGAAGVDVEITELDISVLPFPEEAEQGADIAQDLALQERLNPYAAGLPDTVAETQAAHFQALFRIYLDEADTVARVTFWGVHDGQSWRNGWPMAGRTDYPLTFDRSGEPKPIARALWNLAREAP
jgi:endo-1,4-beta-xylanase